MCCRICKHCRAGRWAGLTSGKKRCSHLSKKGVLQEAKSGSSNLVERARVCEQKDTSVYK